MSTRHRRNYNSSGRWSLCLVHRPGVAGSQPVLSAAPHTQTIFQLKGRAEGDLLVVVRPTTLLRMLGEAFVVVGNPVPYCLCVVVFKVFRLRALHLRVNASTLDHRSICDPALPHDETCS